MPELPEVETTLRGLKPWVVGARIKELVVYDRRLRWPIASDLPEILAKKTIRGLSRRAKYLLFDVGPGSLIVHLGMSGSLRILEAACAPSRWDPFDLVFAGSPGLCLRMRDPRRFGALLYTEDPATHPLIAPLGPEPLEPGFEGSYLHARARGRTLAIRDFLMNGHIVAGIGNIYAHEALFLAGIRPQRAAGRVSRAECDHLADAIVTVLTQAIAAGGTTLKDFRGSDGRPGYFSQELNVYGRTGAPCHRCQTPIRRRVSGARSSYYCPSCQR